MGFSACSHLAALWHASGMVYVVSSLKQLILRVIFVVEFSDNVSRLVSHFPQPRLNEAEAADASRAHG